MKKEHQIIIVFILLILGVAFYWFGVRPYLAKKSCYREANNIRTQAAEADNNMVMRGIDVVRGDYDKLLQDQYNNCLMRKGL